MSNVAQGNALRDDVYQLLQSAKKSNVKREYLLLHKTVDVYYEESSLFQRQTQKLAIECKTDKKFGNTLFSDIYTDYNPLYQQGLVTTVIIITTAIPSPQALKGVVETSWMVHLTYEEFVSSLMNFDLYIQSMQARFKDNGLDSYYVPINDNSGQALSQTIQQWLESDSSKPRAILAGYGMGKTSFALYLTNQAIEQYKKCMSSRIPIYIKLGDLYNEQNLEGLICRMFSSQYVVHGFTYDLFCDYNRNGRFVFILDGFDEMKHAMTFTHFYKNFRELNKLVVKHSKVILLGRPNIFSSDDEKDTVLHGVKNIGDIQGIDPDMPDYKEIEVNVFNHEQLQQFVNMFMGYLYENMLHQRDWLTIEFVEKRKFEILNSNYQELIKRPVHANMLCKVALSSDRSIQDYTRYQLYDEFIKLIYGREMEKAVRNDTDLETRQEFIQQLAWKLWQHGGQSSFTYDMIEKTNPLDKLEQAPYEDMLKELVTGSILDSKGEGLFHFSHRSFQEFLVSKVILHLQLTQNNIEAISSALNDEVIAFIVESDQAAELATNMIENMTDYRGTISLRFTSFIINNIPTFTDDKWEYLFNPWAIYFYGLSHGQLIDILNSQHINSYINIRNASDSDSILTLILTSFLCNTKKEAGYALGAMIFESLPMIERVRLHKGRIQDSVTVETKQQYEFINALLRSLSYEYNADGELTNISISCTECVKNILNYTSVPISKENVHVDIDSVVFNYSVRNFDPWFAAYSDYKDKGMKYRSTFTNFLRSKPQAKHFTLVNKTETNRTAKPILKLKNNS